MTTIIRDLGNPDAASDERFQEHFIESDELTKLRSYRCHIIYGSKGSGKTALRRALSEFHGGLYHTTKTIDLDHLSFEQVHKALSKLKLCSDEQLPTLARNTWRNVLTLTGLEAFSDSLNSRDPLRHRIEAVLEEEGFHETREDSTSRLLRHVSRLLGRINEIELGPKLLGEREPAEPELELTIQVRSIANEFPSNRAVRELLDLVAERIGGRTRVLVCLDGLDSIVDHSPESRKAIFAGLIDAVFKSSLDSQVSSVFCFKAFLPEELTQHAHSIVWDADKFINNTFRIQWSQQEIQRFLRRRLLPYAKTKSKDFADVWSDFMPSRVTNDVHKLDEPSFSYILRHTLYRPRQVLTHVQQILEKWDAKSSVFRVDPTFIPPVVARTNRELAQSVVAQLGHTYAKLDVFMRSFSGMNNVMPAGEFIERVRRIFKCDLTEEQEIIDSLFSFGLFGLAKKGSITATNRAKFLFGFVSDVVAPTYGAVDSDDLVAISPMLHEFCGCATSEIGPITPLV